MPNWCSNFLRVEGNPTEVKRFADMCIVEKENEQGEYEFTMNGILPLPDELKETTAPAYWRGEKDDVEGQAEFEKNNQRLRETYGYDNWYDWQLNNWGTKWDADTINIDSDEATLGISYCTAWSPNEAWVKYAATQFPELKFYLSYEEPGCNFCGLLVCEGGEVSEDTTGELGWQDEDGREVYYDSEKNLYRYTDTNEVIEDEDFCPMEYNPYA